MGNKTDPVITKCKEGENWTKVTFKPDLAKFNMAYLEEDVVALMKKRVVDLAGCLGKSVKVELNGKRVPVKSFLDYVDLYLNSASKHKDTSLPRFFSRNYWKRVSFWCFVMGILFAYSTLKFLQDHGES